MQSHLEIAALADACRDAAQRNADRGADFADWFDAQVHERALRLLLDSAVLTEYLADRDLADTIEIEWHGQQIYVADIGWWLINCSAIERDQILGRVRAAAYAALTAAEGPIAADVRRDLESGGHDE